MSARCGGTSSWWRVLGCRPGRACGCLGCQEKWANERSASCRVSGWETRLYQEPCLNTVSLGPFLERALFVMKGIWKSGLNAVSLRVLGV